MASIKIATLNINGLTSPTRVAMLEAFLWLQEIDILLLQVVTQDILHDLCGYNTHYNIGASMRGTAIVTRDKINLENVTMIPSARAIAAKFQGVWLINIYAPSGTAQKQEREHFFNSELAYLLTGTSGHIFLGGDFNCILETIESAGVFNYSRALAELVHGFAMKDVWQDAPTRKVYTHYSVSGVTRIDHIYASQEVSARKLGVEAVAAEFTYHLVVCLRMSVDIPKMQRWRGLWKLDSAILMENRCKERLCTQWEQLKRQKGLFPDSTVVDQYCKKKIRQFFQREQAQGTTE
jgi:exonuclease III